MQKNIAVVYTGNLPAMEKVQAETIFPSAAGAFHFTLMLLSLDINLRAKLDVKLKFQIATSIVEIINLSRCK